MEAGKGKEKMLKTPEKDEEILRRSRRRKQERKAMRRKRGNRVKIFVNLW